MMTGFWDTGKTICLCQNGSRHKKLQPTFFLNSAANVEPPGRPGTWHTARSRSPSGSSRAARVPRSVDTLDTSGTYRLMKRNV